MFHDVLVGVDERLGGRDAMALGKDLLANDGELTLAYVHLGDAKPTRGSSPAFEAAEQERSRQLLEAARTEAGIDARLAWTGSPSVGRGLHELAERRGADLLVVGSTSRGLLGRVLIGDDTRDALNGAPCAVAIAPAGYSERPVHWREIGVGYDGSPESEHALACRKRTRSPSSARQVSAFEAVLFPLYGRGTGEAIDPLVDEARARIAALGDVEPHAAYGEAAEELALYGASVDVLIVGSRGYGPIGRLVHGSTSQRLAHTARCPLVVLPRATQSSGDPDRPVRTRNRCSRDDLTCTEGGEAMTANRVDIIDGSVEKTHIWLNKLAAELETEDRILRAVLHAVRDRLTVDETAQLSELIRGIYYELWDPSPPSASYHHSKPCCHGSRSQLSGTPTWSPPTKIAARYLALVPARPRPAASGAR